MYRVLVEKPEGGRPFGIPKLRWQDNIREVGCGSMDWIELAHDKESGGRF
jgi:hypothetical protein